MKKWFAIVLVLSILISLSGCANAPKDAESFETVVFTDDCGREVELPADISRIVATGPLSQIVLYTLAPDLFVGLAAKWSGSAEGIVPENYRNLPYFGQLYNTANLNVEELALADPQVIIDIGRSMSTGSEDMDTLQQQTGIPTIFLSASLESLPQTYRSLGKLLGRQEKAEQLASFCEKVYERTLSIMDQVGDHKVTALYITGEGGTNVLPKGSPHSETLDLLTNNLAVVDNPSSKGSGNEVTMEQIALWDPALILFDADSIYDTVAQQDTWRTISAISGGNYLEVPESPWNWMGSPSASQRYLGMIWLTAQLYPEYCDYDVKAEILEFYELFYHCTLTEQQYEELTAKAFLE
jgi:iron complex transport system substrate-binding protein